MRKHLFILIGALSALVAGCTVHPAGESAERNAALAAGEPFRQPIALRPAPPFPVHPSSDDLVRYALLTNADLEKQYWLWRAAIEQIPQDGTQPTNLAISAGTTISNGNVSRDMTTLAALNDPMADIVWPGKLSVAARRALENARAAGLRFQHAKFDLRNKVLSACYDYGETIELIRLDQASAALLQLAVTVADARNRAGAGDQSDILKSRNDLELSRNEIAHLQSQLPIEKARLNAVLNRDATAPLPLPTLDRASPPISMSDAVLLDLAAKHNPQLAAQAAEISGRKDAVELARLQYLPDFSLSAGTDLDGLAQQLAGMVTVPLLRYQAINASITQAEANLRAQEADRKQMKNDLGARIILDLAEIHDADRQLDLLNHSILPRAQQAELVSRSAYETGRSTLLDELDIQRSLIALQRLIVEMQITRKKRLADLETIIALPIQRRPAETTAAGGGGK